MFAIAVVTIAAGTLTTANGVSEVVEAGTNYNFVEDFVFNGNSAAYNTYATITSSVATIGSMICGGWYKHTAPRIQAYKNIAKYNFSDTISDATHLARPYQQSILLQKSIIKYGKMVKEAPGVYKFTISGSFKIGWASYGTGSVGKHPVIWKVVVNVSKQIIYHAGL